MNAIKIKLPGVCVATMWLAVGFAGQAGAAVPDETPAAAGPAETAAATNAAGLLFHFRGAPLEQVLDYLSHAAGYVISLRPGVSLSGTVDAWSEQPLDNDEAVRFLKTVLAEHDLSMVENGRTLTVLRASDVPYETKVILGANPDKIPKGPDIVTQIMPARNLNPLELRRVLQSLLPGSTRLEVNESSGTLLMTDTQANVHRAAEIISALDSVSASANTLKTYPLKYADAKELAGLIKELYTPLDAGRGGGAGLPAFGFGGLPGGNFQGRRGATAAPAGSFGQFGPTSAGVAAGDNSANGTTPQSRVAATADEHGNVLIVSAPDPLMPDLDRLVSTLDVPVEQMSVTDVFPLHNADCQEVADIISKLFPDGQESSDASGTAMQFDGQGNRGAQLGGARQATTAMASGESSRMQKLGRVLAVPDPRTQSVAVNAAESMMPMVAGLIARLDGANGSRMRTHVIPVENADLYDLQQVIQNLFPSATGTAVNANGTVSDPMEQRRTAILNNMFQGGGGGVSANSSGNSPFNRTGIGATGTTVTGQ